MSHIQYQNRKQNHPHEFSIAKERFKLGDNVFLKNDKSKLRGREVYKVVEVFVKDDENWAKLQKSETQFRSKEYLVKCAEIFHVPAPAVPIEDDEKVLEGNAVPDVQNNDADNIPIESEGLKLGDGKTEDVIEVVQVKDAHKLFEDQANNSNDERPRRRAARKNRHNIQEMVAMGILKVNKTDIPKPPTHAWDWDAFRDLVETEDSITVSRSLVNSVEEDVSLDDSLTSSGNNSPVQTPVSLSPVQSPMGPQQFDEVHYD